MNIAGRLKVYIRDRRCDFLSELDSFTTELEKAYSKAKGNAFLCIQIFEKSLVDYNGGEEDEWIEEVIEEARTLIIEFNKTNGLWFEEAAALKAAETLKLVKDQTIRIKLFQTYKDLLGLNSWNLGRPSNEFYEMPWYRITTNTGKQFTEQARNIHEALDVDWDEDNGDIIKVEEIENPGE